MRLANSSRYRVSYDTIEDGAREVAVRTSVNAKSYVTHVVRGKESFASLAQAYLNDERLYWYIADQNPQVKFPDLIPPGTVVRIPIA